MVHVLLSMGAIGFFWGIFSMSDFALKIRENSCIVKIMNSRTPRNYSGVVNPAKKMTDLLPDVLNDLGRKAKDPREEVFRFWNELIGEKMAPMAEPVSFVEGVLTVKVKSSTLYSLLCQ